MTRFLAALVALFTLAAAPAAAQQRPAGFVTGLDLPEGAPAPVLRRQGEALDVQVWRELFDGDALEISGKASVTIETAKDKRLVVDAARSPHRIEGELGGGGKFATFAATLGELFKSKPEKTPANLVGRSNDAAPRLLPGRSDEPQIVVPGQPIWVGWQGGTAPFTVEIRGQTGKRKRDIQALAVANGVDNGAKLTVPAAAAGRLTLVIRDAAGLETRAPLITRAGVPTPRWIREGAPTAEFATLAHAAFLLKLCPHRWDFHAAGMAADLSGEPARRLLAFARSGGRCT